MGTNARDTGPLLRAVATELRVEAARQQLTVRDLARLSQMPYPTVRKSLNGARAIDVEELRKLAVGLGLQAHEILDRAEAALDETNPRVSPEIAALHEELEADQAEHDPTDRR